MSDLERAAEDMVRHPFCEPTPVADLETIAQAYMRRRQRNANRISALVGGLLVVALVLLARQAGGASEHSRSAAVPTTSGCRTCSATTTTAEGQPGETTTTSAASASAATTAPTAAASKTTTSVRAATTARKSTSATSAVSVAPQAIVRGGISNVTSATTILNQGTVTPGGALTLLVPSETAGFDPATMTIGSGSATAAAAVFDMLMYVDPTSGSVVPQTADSLTSADGIVWSLRLRNVKFSDGTPYDAAAVRTNWSRLADPANNSPVLSLARSIEAMDVVDAATLKITLKDKNSQFPNVVASMPFIASPAALRDKGSSFSDQPVGAGPFLLKSARNGQLQLVRNPTYWSAPRPYLDELTLVPLTDETQRADALLTGGTKAAIVTSAAAASRITGSPNPPSSFQLLLNGGLALAFNTSKPPFDDTAARQAVTMAIDVKDYAGSIGRNAADPADSAFRHDSPFYDAGTVQLAYDPVRAQQLFNQIAAAQGGPVTFTLTSPAGQDYPATATYLQNALNKYTNVKVTIQNDELATHTERCLSGDYPSACLVRSAFGDPEPWWTSPFECDAAPSMTGWCDAKFDAAARTARETGDAKQRISSIKSAQAELYDGAPAAYVGRAALWLFTAPAVQDLRLVDQGVPLVDRVWIVSGAVPVTGPVGTTPRGNDVVGVIIPPPTTASRRSVATSVPTTTTTVAAQPSGDAGASTTTGPTTAVASTGGTTPGTTTTTPPAGGLGIRPASSNGQSGVPVGMVIAVAVLSGLFCIAATSAVTLWWRQRTRWWT